MTEKRYIYTNIGVGFEILDSHLGYTGDDKPTEREIEYYDFLVIGLAPTKDSADGICRKLNELADEIEELKSEIGELENENERLENKLWNCMNVR